MPKLGRWAVGLAVAVGIFLAGRASVHVDDEQLRQELADYKASTKQLAGWWADLWKGKAASDARAARAESTAAALRRSAGQHVVLAGVAQASADSFARLRAAAANPRDSLFACVGEVGALRSSCAELRSANADLVAAAGQDSMVKVELSGQVGGLVEGRGRDSTAIATGQRLIGKLERQVRGCRIPLIGFPCPEPMAGLELSHLTLDAGAAVPFNIGRFRFRAFVTKEIATLKPASAAKP